MSKRSHRWKLSRMAEPSLLAASLIVSSPAIAYVALKKSSDGSAVLSARNQEPRATKTPFLMQELKISSSTSKILFSLCGCLV